MKKFLLGGAALVAMFAGSAMAADMPVKAPVLKAPPPVAVYSWTGCYIGGNVGWAHERDKLSTVVPPAPPNNINAAAIDAITNAGLATISGDGVTGGGEALLQHLPRRVVVPTRVHEHRTAVGLEEIDERVAQRVVRDRDGDAPESGTHTLDRRYLADHALPSFALTAVQ